LRPRWVIVAITVVGLAVVAVAVLLVQRFAEQRGAQPIFVDPLPPNDDAWPGQVRAEPAGGAGNVELAVSPGGERLVFEDTTGEIGQGVPEWIDISSIDIQRTATTPGGRGVALDFDLVGAPPARHPSGQVRAYGVVIDSDHDGVPDYRVGMDNAPAPNRREWISNLATGEAIIHDSGTYGMGAFGLFADTYFPGEADRGAEGRLIATDATPGLRFYVWASIIENGGAAKTDYAPDTGWISFQPEPAE
jgi:hypothetical protein